MCVCIYVSVQGVYVKTRSPILALSQFTGLVCHFNFPRARGISSRRSYDTCDFMHTTATLTLPTTRFHSLHPPFSTHAMSTQLFEQKHNAALLDATRTYVMKATADYDARCVYVYVCMCVCDRESVCICVSELLYCMHVLSRNLTYTYVHTFTYTFAHLYTYSHINTLTQPRLHTRRESGG
jgi:hypothetical protein